MELSRPGLVIVIVLCLAVTGASAGEADPHDAVPPEILASAREYAISKVGEEFFDSYIDLVGARFVSAKPENERRRTLPDWIRSSRYELVYRLHIPEKPWIDVRCVINIREDGGLFEDLNAHEGLPDCVSDPLECEFPIDRDAAIEIAREAGLEAGSGAWHAFIAWDGQTHHTYVWNVMNTLYGMNNGRRIAGRGIVIDANTGEVLGQSELVVE